MLVEERTDAPATTESKTTLHLLAGLPAEWIAKVGEVISIERTPTTMGTVVSLKLTRTSATMLHLELDPGARTTDAFIHVPLPAGSHLTAATMDGRAVPSGTITVKANGQQAIVAAPALAHRVSFDFTVVGTAR
jgi:hypothetical protein